MPVWREFNGYHGLKRCHKTCLIRQRLIRAAPPPTRTYFYIFAPRIDFPTKDFSARCEISKFLNFFIQIRILEFERLHLNWSNKYYILLYSTISCVYRHSKGSRLLGSIFTVVHRLVFGGSWTPASQKTHERRKNVVSVRRASGDYLRK